MYSHRPDRGYHHRGADRHVSGSYLPLVNGSKTYLNRLHIAISALVGQVSAYEIAFNLVRGYLAQLPDQRCKNGRVITGSGPDVYYRLTSGRSASCQTHGMQCRLPIVDAAIRQETDDNILVNKARIIRYSREIVTIDKDRPRAWPHILLALCCRKSRDQSLI